MPNEYGGWRNLKIPPSTSFQKVNELCTLLPRSKRISDNMDDSKIILVPGAFASEIEKKALGTWLQKNSAINICFSLCEVAAL